MKQVKTWQYILILYICAVVIDVVKLIVSFSSNGYVMPYGWIMEIAVILIKCLIDMIFLSLIGYGVEFLLKKVTDKTLVPNVIITVLIYEIINFLA